MKGCCVDTLGGAVMAVRSVVSCKSKHGDGKCTEAETLSTDIGRTNSKARRHNFATE